MRVFTTMLNQFCLSLVWLYFMHHFLTPKEKGWKRELYTLPIWFLYLLLTATVLWAAAAIKFILTLIMMFSILYYIYQFEWKRFLITILLIYVNGFLTDTIISLFILLVLQKPLITLTATDNLIFLPMILILSFIMFEWVLKRIRSITNLPSFTLILIISQLPITLLLGMNVGQAYEGRMLVPLLFILLFEVFIQWLIWKKEKNFFTSKQQELLNKQLLNVHQDELNAYLSQKDQEEMHRKLRHDLLNEIAMITLLENETNNS